MVAIVSLLVVFMIITSQVLEIYANIVKGTSSKQLGRQLLGYGNLLQYISRILYVFILFSFAFMFEVQNQTDLIPLIVITGFAVSFPLSILILIYKSPRLLLRKAVYPLMKNSFSTVSSLDVIVIKHKVTLNFYFLWSIFASTLISIAMVIPFLVADILPEFRMLATYSSQILNFLATATLLSVVEPKMFKELDKDNEETFELCSVGYSLVISKVIAQLIMMLWLAVYIMIN